MSIACCIRFIGGYQYGYYIAPFFSEFYTKQDDGGEVDCTYSYDATTEDETHACHDSDFPYCIDGACQKVSSTPWHNEGMDASTYGAWFAGATVVGSVPSAIVGGYIGDFALTYTGLGESARLLVAGVSLLIAAPCYYLVYTLPYPSCFIMLGVGGFFGEMYYTQTLAALASVIPKKLFPIAIAFFLSLLTLLASNGTVLIPLVKESLDAMHEKHDFTIHCAPTYVQFKAGTPLEPDVLQTFTQTGSSGLQETLCILVCGSYAVAGGLFLLTMRQLKVDFERIQIARTDGLMAGLD